MTYVNEFLKVFRGLTPLPLGGFLLQLLEKGILKHRLAFLLHEIF